MHLQQTKKKSRATGGPQYYFHGIAAPVKEFLRKRGVCPVVLQTPYGIAGSAFMAVGRDHKMSGSGEVIPGSVGHDRIQQGSGDESIGAAIRHWHGVKAGGDFERIDVEVVLHHEGHFIVVPTAVKMRTSGRIRALEKVAAPLSFHRDYQSKLWKKQIAARRQASAHEVSWAAAQIRRVVTDHRAADFGNTHEADLLRASGALSVLGLNLSPYLVKGYDCPRSRFQFQGLPDYVCPVEIKKRSARFDYQITKYSKLPRAVILCMRHDLVNPPEHVDVVELGALADYLEN